MFEVVVFDIFSIETKTKEKTKKCCRQDPMHTTPEAFEKRSLPFILINHENGAFRKLSSNRKNLKTLGFGCRVNGNHFENRVFRKLCRHGNHVVFLTEFSSNVNPKWPVIVAFLNSSVVWPGNIWCVFKVKPPFWNFYGEVSIGHYSKHRRCYDFENLRILSQTSSISALSWKLRFNSNNFHISCFFLSRLVEDDERKWTDENVNNVALKHFPNIDRNAALVRPILFSNWLSKDYMPVEQEELRDFVKARLKVWINQLGKLFCDKLLVGKLCQRLENR